MIGMYGVYGCVIGVSVCICFRGCIRCMGVYDVCVYV